MGAPRCHSHCFIMLTTQAFWAGYLRDEMKCKKWKDDDDNPMD